MKRNKLIISILMVGLLLFTMAYIGVKTFSVSTFELGYEPYGESSNQITDFREISYTCRDSMGQPYPNIVSGAQCVINSDSKYWTFETNTYNCDRSNIKFTSSNDFNINMGYSRIATQPGEGMGYCNIGGTATTKEYFGDRDFKASISRGLSTIKFYLVTDSNQKILAYSSDGSSVTNLIISPSVISNNIYVHLNGQLYKTLNSNANYKVQIVVDRSDQITITNPSYKQQFGCTTLPSEQTYLSVFKEGDIINLNKLDRFNKFCLDESPLKVYSNTGSTIDIEVLQGLVNNEQYTVPAGQIWTIEYIGDKSTFVTECESSEVYVQNDKTCIARAMITLTCPSDSSFDSEKGFCVVETKPYVYYTETIATHQALEQKGEVLLSHIRNEDNSGQFKSSGDSINILGNFKSDGVSYNGMEVGNVNYPEDESNWKVSFSYNGVSYEGKLNDEIELSDYLNVKISEIGGWRSGKTNSVETYKVNYLFNLDTSFIEISENSGKVIVKNNLMNLDGGITLTTLNNIGTTRVETIDKTLILGNTEFVVDTKNLLEIKARPYISISTPAYDYKIDTKNAISVSLESQVGTTNPPECSNDACCKEKGFDVYDSGVCKKVAVETLGFNTSTIVIFSLVGIVILMSLILLMLKIKK